MLHFIIKIALVIVRHTQFISSYSSVDLLHCLLINLGFQQSFSCGLSLYLQHPFPSFFNKMSSSFWWKAAPQQQAATTILHNELCAFWGVGSVRFARTTLNLGLTSSIRHQTASFSYTAARSLLMFVPHGSVGVMAFFVPSSLIGQCYSKLLMRSGCFDVLFTSW